MPAADGSHPRRVPSETLPAVLVCRGAPLRLCQFVLSPPPMHRARPQPTERHGSFRRPRVLVSVSLALESTAGNSSRRAVRQSGPLPWPLRRPRARKGLGTTPERVAGVPPPAAPVAPCLSAKSGQTRGWTHSLHHPRAVVPLPDRHPSVADAATGAAPNWAPGSPWMGVGGGPRVPPHGASVRRARQRWPSLPGSWSRCATAATKSSGAHTAARPPAAPHRGAAAVRQSRSTRRHQRWAPALVPARAPATVARAPPPARRPPRHGRDATAAAATGGGRPTDGGAWRAPPPANPPPRARRLPRGGGNRGARGTWGPLARLCRRRRGAASRAAARAFS